MEFCSLKQETTLLIVFSIILLSHLFPFVAVPFHDVHKQLMQPKGSSDETARIVNVPEEYGFFVEKQSFGKAPNTQVIELSDDDEEKREVLNKDTAAYGDDDDDVSSLMWHYLDPQGEIQGPFSLKSLKAWMDADYFPNDFKVWKTGRNKDRAVLLIELIRTMFPI